MYKLICLLCIIQIGTIKAQLFEKKFYFDKCKDTYNSSRDTCVDFEMKNFIYEKIVKVIPIEKLNNKSELKLNIKIDSTGNLNTCVLTWKQGKKYFMEDIKPKVRKVHNFNNPTEVTVHYSISENRSKFDSKIYSHIGQIFKVVQVMPSWDSCYFNLNQTTCANSKFFDIITKNMSKSKFDKNSLKKEKINFSIVVMLDGYIGDIFIRNIKDSTTDELLLDAINKVKKQGLRFFPGFQGNKPIDVLLSLEYYFDPAKI